MNCGGSLRGWEWELCGRDGCELRTINIQLYVIGIESKNNDGKY